MEEKKIIPLDNKIKIIYENREMTVELKYILEKDDIVVISGGPKLLASTQDSKIIGGIAKI